LYDKCPVMAAQFPQNQTDRAYPIMPVFLDEPSWEFMQHTLLQFQAGLPTAWFHGFTKAYYFNEQYAFKRPNKPVTVAEKRALSRVSLSTTLDWGWTNRESRYMCSVLLS